MSGTLAIAALLLALSSESTERGPFEIRFLVTEAPDASPVAGVDVILRRGMHVLGTTESDGSITVQVPGPADHALYFRRGNCSLVSRTVTALVEEQPIQVQLPSVGAIKVAVRKLDERGLGPAAAVIVTVERHPVQNVGHQPGESRYTDDRGVAEFCVVAGVSYDVGVRHPGYGAVGRNDIAVPANTTKALDLAIQPGEPHRCPWVSPPVRKLNERPRPQTQTESDGR